jgi:hypothetical protein
MAAMEKIYRPAKGARYGKKEAQALGEIVDQFGESFAPLEVVKAARSKASPIHRLFEWNDGAAADAFRLVQARTHLNHLQIVIVTPKGVQKRTRAVHSVIVSQERCYARMEDVFSNPELREQVIAKALADANGWAARFSEIKSVGALRDIFAAIKRANEKTVRRKQKVA